MTGLGKIIAKIEDNGRTVCKDIISKADAQAQMILDNARSTAENSRLDAIDAANKKSKIDIELASSKAEHESKKTLLATKISIINDVIDEAMKKLKSLPDIEYFNTIKILVSQYACNGLGTLRFSQSDISRLPQSFEASLNEALKGSDRAIVISSEPVCIDGGFVIVYDDIEQNCSFDSLMNASLDEIKDALYEEIFMRDSI